MGIHTRTIGFHANDFNLDFAATLRELVLDVLWLPSLNFHALDRFAIHTEYKRCLCGQRARMHFPWKYRGGGATHLLGKPPYFPISAGVQIGA